MWPAERGASFDSASGGDNYSIRPCISEAVKRNLLHLLKTQRHGTNVDSLLKCYRDEFGSKLDYKKHGFDSLLDMLKTVPEIR